MSTSSTHDIDILIDQGTVEAALSLRTVQRCKRRVTCRVVSPMDKAPLNFVQETGARAT